MLEGSFSTSATKMPHEEVFERWFERFPHAAGANPDDKKLNNWWKYVFAINQPDRMKPE